MVLAIGAFLLLMLLGVAWIDGGKKPMRWIEQPVTVPAKNGAQA